MARRNYSHVNNLLISLFLVSCTIQVEDEIMVDPIHVKVVQPPKTGWAMSGTVRVANPNGGFTMQKEFPQADTYTIAFSVIPPAPVSGIGVVIRPRALISWNVEGDQLQREITIGLGTSISGRAKAVAINIFDDMQGLPTTLGTSYTVIAHVSKGVRASGQYPIFQPKNIENPVGTPVIDGGSILLANATAAQWEMPLGAVSIWANLVNSSGMTPVTENSVIYRFIDPSGSIINFAQPGFPPVWVPIPTNSKYVQLRNDSGGPLDASVLFGIDG